MGVPDAIAADWAAVRSILRVQLTADDTTNDVPGMVTRGLASGIRACLMFDFSDSNAAVLQDHVAGWPVDADGAMEQGLANLALEPLPRHEEVDTGEARFTVWHGEEFSVATRAIGLTDLVPPGTTEALVVVPSRHALAVHPIVDGTALPAMQAMFRPQSISTVRVRARSVTSPTGGMTASSSGSTISRRAVASRSRHPMA